MKNKRCFAIAAAFVAIFAAVGFAPPETAIRTVANLFGNRIKNLGAPVEDNDAVTKSFATNASNLATGVIPTSVSPTLSFNSSGTINSESGASGVTVANTGTGIYTLTRDAAGSANVPVLATAWTNDEYAVTTDAINDYVAGPNLTALSGQSAYTVFMKVRINSTLSQRCALFQQFQSSTRFCGIRLFDDANSYLYFDSDSANYASVNSATAGFSVGNWVTCAVVYNGAASGNSNRLKLLINNAQATLSFTGTIGASYATNTGAFEVGRWNYQGSYTYGNLSVGRMLVYGSALDSTALTTLHEGGVTGSPVLRWEFTDGSGTTVSDSSGNSRTGTLTNGPTWSTIAGTPLLARVTSQTSTASTLEFTTPAGAKRNPSTACVWLGR